MVRRRHRLAPDKKGDKPGISGDDGSFAYPSGRKLKDKKDLAVNIEKRKGKREIFHGTKKMGGSYYSRPDVKGSLTQAEAVKNNQIYVDESGQKYWNKQVGTTRPATIKIFYKKEFSIGDRWGQWQGDFINDIASEFNINEIPRMATEIVGDEGKKIPRHPKEGVGKMGYDFVLSPRTKHSGTYASETHKNNWSTAINSMINPGGKKVASISKRDSKSQYSGDVGAADKAYAQRPLDKSGMVLDPGWMVDFNKFDALTEDRKESSKKSLNSNWSLLPNNALELQEFPNHPNSLFNKVNVCKVCRKNVSYSSIGICTKCEGQQKI